MQRPWPARHQVPIRNKVETIYWPMEHFGVCHIEHGSQDLSKMNVTSLWTHVTVTSLIRATPHHW